MNNNSDVYTRTFADRLLELIKEKGLKLKDIEKETSIAAATLSKYQNDESTASISNLATLAKFFGVTTEYLLGRSDHKTNENDAIGKILGLSDEAINSLILSHKMEHYSKSQRELIKTINMLITQETPPPNISSIVSRDASEEEKEKADEVLENMEKDWKDKNYIKILSAINDYLIIDLSNSDQYYIFKDGRLEMQNKDGMKNLYQEIKSQVQFDNKVIENILLFEIQRLLQELKTNQNRTTKKGDEENGKH